MTEGTGHVWPGTQDIPVQGLKHVRNPYAEGVRRRRRQAPAGPGVRRAMSAAGVAAAVTVAVTPAGHAVGDGVGELASHSYTLKVMGEQVPTALDRGTWIPLLPGPPEPVDLAQEPAAPDSAGESAGPVSASDDEAPVARREASGSANRTTAGEERHGGGGRDTRVATGLPMRAMAVPSALAWPSVTGSLKDAQAETPEDADVPEADVVLAAAPAARRGDDRDDSATAGGGRRSDTTTDSDTRPARPDGRGTDAYAAVRSAEADTDGRNRNTDEGDHQGDEAEKGSGAPDRQTSVAGTGHRDGAEHRDGAGVRTTTGASDEAPRGRHAAAPTDDAVEVADGRARSEVPRGRHAAVPVDPPVRDAEVVAEAGPVAGPEVVEGAVSVPGVDAAAVVGVDPAAVVVQVTVGSDALVAAPQEVEPVPTDPSVVPDAPAAGLFPTDGADPAATASPALQADDLAVPAPTPPPTAPPVAVDVPVDVPVVPVDVPVDVLDAPPVTDPEVVPVPVGG